MKLSAAQTATLMALLTIVSKCFGFIREMVLAGYYGTSEITDIYVLANSIPMYLLGSFFLAVGTTYMPLLAENDKKGKVKTFTDQVFSIVLIISAVAVIVGILFSKQLVILFGYEGNSAQMAGIFCRISFCYIIFSAIGNIQSSYLQYKGVFLPQIIAGYLLSISAIVCIVLSAKFSIYLLPMAYLVGYSSIAFVQAIVARRKQYTFRPNFHLKGTFRDILTMAPMVFIGGMVNSINGFVDKMFATSLKEGSVSSLNYGNLINTMIMSISILIITSIIYPRMTRAAANNELGEFSLLVQKGITLILIITIPFTFGIVAFHSEVVQVIYERGAFGTASTGMTSSAFLYYGLGLIFISINQLIVNAYYSLRNMKTSVWCGMFGVLVNIVMDFILIRYMAHAGLALASSVAIFINTITLTYFFKKRYPEIKLISSAKKIVQITLSAGIAVTASFAVYHFLDAAIWMPRMFYLLIAVAAAGVVYLILLKQFNVEELNMLKKIVYRGK